MTAAAVASSPASRRLRATNHEYTPFLRAGVPVTYGAAQRGDPSEDRSQVDGLHGEDAVAFGRWPWRALNRQWWRWQLESTLRCCCSDESDNDE
ncbi:hypothetical protein DFH94DRAFT_736700 [Russula ochroleuca]|uniref:Uncharacterized protein n=1 Tax=Russula ochroleuca TaxID=152965 RepID=A0A9P5T9Q8_9AGAM|nr:hypothetical protein DFH94DRAFT_736700 [Russula ochroleuca]